MLFNVSGLVQEGIGATRRYEIDEELRGEGRQPEPVTGTVEMLRTKAGILVRAHLELVEPETCSRCLEPLQETVPIDFEEEFQTTVDVHTGQPVSDGLDEEAFKIDQNHMLDLREAVRQYREASEEMQPLCRPNCRGLCPRCGKNLNEGDCDCNAAPVDTRWSALAGLMAESEGKE